MNELRRTPRKLFLSINTAVRALLRMGTIISR